MAKGNPFAKGKKTKAAFERSSFDNDRGVKEGSPADKKRDKGQFEKFKKAKK